MALDKLLFSAKPDGFGSYTFTRSSSGYEISRLGVLQLLTTDKLRVDYLDIDGDGERETPAFLLELASTNLYTRSEEFDHADWTKTNVTVVADNSIAADNSTTADLIVPSTLANIHVADQTLGVTASVDHALTVYASPGGYNFLSLRMIGDSTTSLAQAHYELTSSGAVVDSGVAGAGGVLTTARIDRIRTDQYRCTLVGQVGVSTDLNARVYIAETSSQMALSWAGSGSSGGLGVNLWGAQFEDDQAFETSAILSSAAATARAADTLYFPFTHAPQEMTVYVKFKERGTILTGDTSAVMLIGDAAASDLGLQIRNNASGLYTILHDNGPTNVTSTLAAAPSVGDTVELRGILNADGSVQIGQSINDASETTSVLSAANALASAWQDTRLYVNSRGTAGGYGSSRVLEIKIAAGVKTMAEMRSLDPFFAAGGITVPVGQNGSDESRQEIGDRDRTFDGTLRETIRSRVSVWDADTVPLLPQDANDVQEMLESSTQPQTAFGDMIAGSTGEYPDVFTRVNSRTAVQSSTDRRYILNFTAEESS